MTNKILIKQSATPGSVPTESDLDWGELALNTADGVVYLKYDDGTGPQIGKVGSTTPIANTYFVQVTGDDNEDGQTWDTAFQTIEKALEVATARKEADPTAITLIDIGPGRYQSNGH